VPAGRDPTTDSIPSVPPSWAWKKTPDPVGKEPIPSLLLSKIKEKERNLE
jgi:hypothetical protein